MPRAVFARRDTDRHGEVEDLELVDQPVHSTATKQVLAAVKGVNDDPEVGSSSPTVEERDGSRKGTKSTAQDVAAMQRMGKSQQLIRQFRFLSIMSFTALATASWEIGLFLITPGLVDGGRAGLVWSNLWTFIGFAPIYISMAEMASMAPIAGAQYHWVSEFAPQDWQRSLSYITGWTSSIAWQAGNAQGVFLVGSLVQTMILLNDEMYLFPNWHGTLLAIGAVIIGYIGCVYGAKILPYWQTALFSIHIMAYFAYIIPVWVNAPAATHHEVWGEFSNYGGWSSMGLAVCVGQLGAFAQQCTGIDTAAHMSEEVRNAADAIPKAMIAVFVCNFCLIFPAILTIVYHCPDLDAALDDSTTYPAIYVLRQAMSTPWVCVILCVMGLLTLASNIVYLTAVSRDVFAFARDKGLPFSDWLGTVDKKRHIPTNATIVSSVISILLSMIYIGSPVAFYAICSLFTVALLQCYCLSIGCVLWRRIAKPETLPPATFSLGKWGVPINSAAVIFAIWCFFWAFWPQATPTDAAGFNWASPIFVITLLGSGVYFVFKGKNRYFGPVLEVEGRKQDFM